MKLDSFSGNEVQQRDHVRFRLRTGLLVPVHYIIEVIDSDASFFILVKHETILQNLPPPTPTCDQV